MIVEEAKSSIECMTTCSSIFARIEERARDQFDKTVKENYKLRAQIREIQEAQK